MNDYLKEQLQFIEDYKVSSNAATGSKYDSNANVTEKNIATLATELDKKAHIDLQRAVMRKYITALGGEELANQYEADLAHHIIYRHDETAGAGGFPYCVAMSLYPFLTDGLTKVGGNSKAPQHTDSFIGGFVNLLFIVAAQYAGACLYKNQRINIKYKNTSYAPTIKEFVDYFNPQFDYPGQPDWKYTKVLSEIEVYEQNRWVKIKNVFKRNYKESIYKITTKNNREVYCSKDHKFKILNKGLLEDCPAEQLQIGDTLINTQQEFNICKDNDDYLLGQLIGIIAGDGCITSENEVRIAINYNDNFIIDFLNKEIFKLTNKQPSLYEGHNCYDMRICSRDLVKYIKNFFVGQTTKDKALDLSKSYSNEFLCGFLDGLLVTDGLLGGSFTCQVISEGLIDNIIEIMYRLTGERLEKRTYQDSREDRQILYKTTIPLKYYKLLDLTLKFKRKEKYADLNNSLGKHKETYYVGPRYSKFSRSKKPYQLLCDTKFRPDYGTDVITGIELIENDDDYVYEIETESHYYSINGYLTHNCAVPETLTYLDHFLRKDYGSDYYLHLDKVVEYRADKAVQLKERIEGWFAQLVYTINQPAAARGNQSIFFNIAYFDKYYFESVFDEFIFPDGDEPCWESTSTLQKLFMEWLNNERLKNVITFPVETVNLLVQNDEYADEETANWVAEMWSKGASFFLYQSDSVDALSSCCRLLNAIENRDPFSYTLGAGGIMTGSKAVISLNLNRIVQDWKRENDTVPAPAEEVTLSEYITPIVNRVHKYLEAFNNKIWDDYNAGLLTIYKAGFIDLDKQFLTTGVGAFVEAAEFLGIPVRYDDIRYQQLAKDLLGTIERLNKEHRSEHCKYNLEFVPGEGMLVKFAKWDKRDGYFSPRDTYNSYFYPIENTMNVIDRFYYQGKGFADVCSGGVALHNNLQDHLTAKQYRMLMDIAVKAGCNYFTYNIPNTICNDCGHISKHMLEECPKCGSTNLDYATRIIGYLKRISNFSEARQREAAKRYYA